MTLTMDDSKGWHMREAAHYNGGEVFFAYLFRCVEQPRLSRFDRYERKDRSVTSTWKVDGADAPSLEAAVVALNSPPEFTADELAELTKVTDTFTDIRKTRDYALNDALVNKGAIEWEAGKCRLTALGAAQRAKEGE